MNYDESYTLCIALKSQSNIRLMHFDEFYLIAIVVFSPLFKNKYCDVICIVYLQKESVYTYYSYIVLLKALSCYPSGHHGPYPCRFTQCPFLFFFFPFF